MAGTRAGEVRKGGGEGRGWFVGGSGGGVDTAGRGGGDGMGRVGRKKTCVGKPTGTRASRIRELVVVAASPSPPSNENNTIKTTLNQMLPLNMNRRTIMFTQPTLKRYGPIHTHKTRTTIQTT